MILKNYFKLLLKYKKKHKKPKKLYENYRLAEFNSIYGTYEPIEELNKYM